MIKFFLTLFFFQSTLFAKNAPELTIAIIQEWSAFNPINSQLASNDALFPFIIRKMVRRSADGGVVADLAEAIPKLKKENGKFLATWTIRKSAKWADGHMITCADWHLGWTAGLNKNVSVETRTYYEKISSITWNPLNPQSCLVSYLNSDWSYDRDLPPLLPAHLEQTTYEKFKGEPEGYDRNTNYIKDTLNKGLYNGPYFVSEFKLGSHIILSRNDSFFGTKPTIEKIIIKHLSDTSALKANLLAGQINGISAVGFPPDSALQMDEDSKDPNSAFRVRFQNSGIFQGLYFNLESDVFKDPKVREALSRAIDKDKIVKAFFNGKLVRAESILAPQHPAYKNQLPIFSIEKAKKLLDEAGWKAAANGIRQKNGKPLSFIFKTSAGLKVLENIQVYICEEYKKIGAQCVIKNEPPRTLLGQSVPHGDFDLSMFGQPIPPDSSITSYFSSKDIPTEKNSWTGGNQIRLNSKDLDQLLTTFDQEPDRQKRNAIIQKIEAFLQSRYLMIPLYHRREAIVVPKKLSGLSDSYEGTGFNQPENWKL